MKADVILVVAAHPDDEVLGVGGTLARLARGGAKTHVVYLATGITGRHEATSQAGAEIDALTGDARRAAALLGVSTQTFLGLPDNRLDTVPRMDIVRELNILLDRLRPDVVFTHHHGDYNWDHRAAHEATVMACRACPGEVHPATLLTYEVPSSTERAIQHSGTVFLPTVYVDIAADLDAKLAALAAYSTEVKQPPHPRSVRALETWAQKRGNEVGLAHAEAFSLARCILGGGSRP